MIKIAESPRSDNFTNEQLKNLIKQSESPSVVVRNLYASNTDVSSNANTHRITSILEMGLAKNGLDVRDRSLFDNILKSTSANNTYQVDYQKLYEQTQVDLLIEISDYSVNDLYKVEHYWVGNQRRYFPAEEKLVNGKNQKYNPTYLFRGMSLSIKVIILKDNLIGGTYHYTYVPCSESDGGAIITQLRPLRYTPLGGGQDINAIIYDDSNSSLVQSGRERLDQAMENYITHTVVPQMMADMKGQVYHKPEPVAQTTPVVPVTEPTVAPSELVTAPTPAPTPAPTIAPSEPITTPTVAPSEPVTAPTPAPAVAKQKSVDLEKLRNIVPVNSFDKLAQAVSNLIHMNITKQEKAKKVAQLKTDLDRLLAIKKGEYIRELENFVTTNTDMVGLTQPSIEDDMVIIYLSTQVASREQSMLLFVDGQCVGVGSGKKGFYSAFPLEKFGAGFHTLTITATNGARWFASTVDFSLKNQFIFKSNRGRIELTN
jgi:hypothetical protein